MFCFKCGFNMPDTSTVCPQCGAAVQNTPQPPAQAASPSAAPSGQPGQPVSPWLNVPTMQPAQTSAQQPVYAAQPQTDGKATASLVLGILSVTCLGLLTGIPAIILGHISRKNIRESMGRLKGEGMALAGLIMGYVSLAVIPLIIAAIAIPSLLRSRIAANNSAAVSTVRTINTGQVTYMTTYPNAGYARDLASMGPGDGDCSSRDYSSPQHACLLDRVIGGPTCTGSNWCTKYGYKFAMVGTCAPDMPCSGYVVTATPVTTGTTGTKTFCSISDLVIRYTSGLTTSQPLTEDECRALPPVE